MTQPYDIWIKEQDFRIPQGRILAAILAISELLRGPSRIFKGLTGEHAFDPTIWSGDLNKATIEELFETFWWNIEWNHRGVGGIEADRIHHGLAYALFHTVAPFVEDGSFVEFHDEDGDHYQFTFRGGKVEERQAEVVWRADEDHTTTITEENHAGSDQKAQG